MRSRLVGTAVLAAVYLGVAKLGLMIGAVAGFATLVWPPTGIAIVALVRFGPRLAPGIAIGAFAVNAWTGAPLGVAAGIAIGNTLEALVALWMLQRAGFQPLLDRTRDVLALVAVAVISPLASATLGVGSLWLGGVVDAGAAPAALRAWWLGDAMGALVVAPILFVASGLRGDGRPPSRRRATWWELLAMSLALVATALVSFGVTVDIPALRVPYVVFPALIWASMRFGHRGAAIATFVVSAIAIASTYAGYGAFADSDVAASLFALQAFMAIVAVTMLLLGAISDERDAAIAKRQQFLEVVSHELKNPLGAIQLSTEVLLARLGRAETDAPLVKRVEVIQRSANRMHSLVQNLLDVGAIEGGRLAVLPREEDAHAIVDEALDGVAAQAAARKQTLEKRLPDDKLVVLCDRDRVVQVLVNLVGNAIKFAPEASTISVALEADEPGGPHARFSVTDRGPGLTPEQVEHVFERYWQASHDSTKGRGLGLYISKGLVHAHRGELWVESPPGGGATFRFTLPISDTSSSTPRTASRR